MRHIILILAILCASCSGYAIKPYKLDIQQGNVVTSKMMLQLKPGMSKSQVRFIMGTPLIQDAFHSNRWDYFYQFRKDGKIIEQRRVILDFEQDALARVRGDVIPAGSGEPVVDPQPISNSTKTTAKESQKRSWLDRLQFWKGEDKNAERPQAAPDDLVNSKSTQSEPKQETRKPAPPVAPAEEPAVVPAPAKKLEVKPALMPTEPAPGPATGPDESVQPAEQQPAATPPAVKQAAPVPEPAAEPTAQPQAAPAPVAKPKPAAKTEPVSKPAEKPAPAPEPDKELPPEDEPGYFERMLEKIGF